MSYDSRVDTETHIRRVQDLIAETVKQLESRADVHDQSKLHEPEKSAFDRLTPLLKDTTYGTHDYHDARLQLGDALAHHYAANSHHPEHYANGFDGMSLLDLLEMMCDWKAAGERHANGSMAQSLEVNRTRFGMSDQLHRILTNTAHEMRWIKEE